MKIRVVIADDQQILRDGLRAILASEPDFEVLGDTDNGRELLRQADELRPDIAVLGLTLHELCGVEATRRLTEKHPNLNVVALTESLDSSIVSEILEAGASAYMLKENGRDDLLSALRTVREGNSYLSPRAADLVIENHVRSHAEPAKDPVFIKLSAREREVLQLLAEGKTSKAIAYELGISSKTVDTHRRNLMKKLDTDNLATLVKMAIRAGISPLDPAA